MYWVIGNRVWLSIKLPSARSTEESKFIWRTSDQTMDISLSCWRNGCIFTVELLGGGGRGRRAESGTSSAGSALMHPPSLLGSAWRWREGVGWSSTPFSSTVSTPRSLSLTVWDWDAEKTDEYVHWLWTL